MSAGHQALEGTGGLCQQAVPAGRPSYSGLFTCRLARTGPIVISALAPRGPRPGAARRGPATGTRSTATPSARWSHPLPFQQRGIGRRARSKTRVNWVRPPAAPRSDSVPLGTPRYCAARHPLGPRLPRHGHATARRPTAAPMRIHFHTLRGRINFGPFWSILAAYSARWRGRSPAHAATRPWR